MQDFHGLAVWRRANGLAVEVRRATRALRRRGYSALGSQVTRAAESIAFNIAEGCGAQTRRDFARFLDMAIRSASEVEAELQLAKDYGVLDESSWRSLTTETVEIRKMLFGLRAAVLRPESERRPGGRKPGRPPDPETGSRS